MRRLTSKQIHVKIKAKTRETAGPKGSQAPNTSGTNRHFDGVISHFLFVVLHFLSLSRSGPAGQGDPSVALLSTYQMSSWQEQN